MNWIEIMRLIIALWPLIEQIIDAITNVQNREAVANEVTNVVAKLLDGTIPVSNSSDVAVALAKPLKIAA